MNEVKCPWDLPPGNPQTVTYPQTVPKLGLIEGTYPDTGTSSTHPTGTYLFLGLSPRMMLISQPKIPT